MPLLADYARSLLGLELLPTQIEQFERLMALLLEWNQRLNLTGITEPDAIVIKHFLDSLSLLKVLPATDGKRLIDVGSGAGFPGLALAIVLPRLKVTLLDSTAKKLRFIDRAADDLGLQNIRTLHARAEDAGQMRRHRESYDLAVARAVAKLPTLFEYTLPLAEIGGLVITMQGSQARVEVKTAAKAMKRLGGELRAIETVTLPTLDQPRHLVIVEKRRKTESGYPRRAGTPARNPIQ